MLFRNCSASFACGPNVKKTNRYPNASIPNGIKKNASRPIVAKFPKEINVTASSGKHQTAQNTISTGCKVT